jgi:hypothetical protein
MRESLLLVKRVPDYVLIDRTMFFLIADRRFVNRLSDGPVGVPPERALWTSGRINFRMMFYF